MLSPPSSNETWVPKPGNPNFLIPKEKEEKPPEEKKPKIKIEPEPEIDEPWIASVLRDGMAPLQRFIGMLEAESGTTVYYKYRENATAEERTTPMVFGTKTTEEFRERNAHLGVIVLSYVAPEKEKKFLDNMVNDQRWFAATGYAENTDYLPQWVWNHFEEPVFRFILSQSTFGALQLAANELEFPLKSLIESEAVNFMFAQFVARKFITPKQNASVSGISNGQLQFRISSGYHTSQMGRSKWLIGCKLWFKSVILVDNPGYIAAREAYQKIQRDPLSTPSRVQMAGYIMDSFPPKILVRV